MESTNLPPASRPMNEPHTPITMDEMNPNIHNEPPKSAKSSLLTLASLLILAGIVGITLWLYIQNKHNDAGKVIYNNYQKTITKSQQVFVTKGNKENYASIVKKYGLKCEVFTSIKEALKNPINAC